MMYTRRVVTCEAPPCPCASPASQHLPGSRPNATTLRDQGARAQRGAKRNYGGTVYGDPCRGAHRGGGATNVPWPSWPCSGTGRMPVALGRAVREPAPTGMRVNCRADRRLDWAERRSTPRYGKTFLFCTFKAGMLLKTNEA